MSARTAFEIGRIVFWTALIVGVLLALRDYMPWLPDWAKPTPKREQPDPTDTSQ